MPVNADKPHIWKEDVRHSVDFYNDWFIQFAPKAYRDTRIETTARVESALSASSNLARITVAMLRKHPEVLPILRMSTAPPIARDRLIGLAGVPAGLVQGMEKQQRIISNATDTDIARIAETIEKLLDRDIFPWLHNSRQPRKSEVHRAATIIADRLCGALADPIIRNAQEQRQLAVIAQWLELRGYTRLKSGKGITLDSMKPGTFIFRLNVPVRLSGGEHSVQIPVDVVVMPHNSQEAFPLLIEAKSAGDFTNTNKRRKEEAIKMSQLRGSYGSAIHYVLFLCGYFDAGYLGYEAAEGIDWVWEHRIEDLALLGL